jgi:large subunit ribosomal protein L13
MREIMINAEDCIAGRLASLVAKRLLNGEEIRIVNAEKAVISGDPKVVFDIFKGKISRGDPYHGPFYPRRPDMVLKRMVRGMLPKKPRGRDAYKRLKVFISIPEEFKNREFEIMERAKNDLECKFTTLEKLYEKMK